CALLQVLEIRALAEPALLVLASLLARRGNLGLEGGHAAGDIVPRGGALLCSVLHLVGVAHGHWAHSRRAAVSGNQNLVCQGCALPPHHAYRGRTGTTPCIAS